MNLPWPSRRGLRLIPVLSAHRFSAAGIGWSGLVMSGLGLALPLLLMGPDWHDETRSLERSRQELGAALARARAKLQEMQAALPAGDAPKVTAVPAGADRTGLESLGADRLQLHRLALAQGLRLEALKSAGDASAGAALSLQLRGNYGALVSYLAALAHSDSAWGLQNLHLVAGTDRGHRLNLLLETLLPGPWMQAQPEELGPRVQASVVTDPFAAPLPAPSPVPPADAVTPDPLAGVPAHWRGEFARERQPLEAQALRELSFTGTFRQGQTWVALVRFGGMVHTVKEGDYLGPDFGRVQAVDQDGLDLRELKRDQQGRWAEQMRRWGVGATP